jgi:hypothetical protein
MQSEFTIQNSLFYDLQKKSEIVITNFTPKNWWECDIWAVSKSGYATEYEIKISRADFKKDVEKERRVRGIGCQMVTEKKCDILQECVSGDGHTHPPKHFYYVTPEDMVEPDEIPEYAGHIVMCSRVSKTLKRAPVLHRDKADQGDIDNAKRAFYYRYWNMRERLESTKKKEKMRKLTEGQDLLWWMRKGLGEENTRKVVEHIGKKQQTVTNILLAADHLGL